MKKLKIIKKLKRRYHTSSGRTKIKPARREEWVGNPKISKHFLDNYIQEHIWELILQRPLF